MLNVTHDSDRTSYERYVSKQGRIERLQSENTTLKRRLDNYESPVVDLTHLDDDDDGEGDDATQHHDKRLREEYDRKTQERLVKVKEEKVAAEGARDRTDAIAAAASVAAASASADAREAAGDLEDAQELTGHLVQSENNKMSQIDELRRTVSELRHVSRENPF